MCAAKLQKPPLELLRESPFFDREWYELKHPDVVLSGLEAVEHYLIIGANLQRDPGPNFSVKAYLANNQDVAAEGWAGFLHYLQHGINENRGGYQPLSRDAQADLLISPHNATVSRQKNAPTAVGAVKHAKKIRGDLNSQRGTVPIVKGWLGELGNPSARNADIFIDGKRVATIKAELFREDLKKNGINDGAHAFEFLIPEQFIDGINHRITLKDQASGQEIKSVECVWSHNRAFTSFAGFLANSYVNPYMHAPFREEDKRALAAMENIAANLVRAAKQSPEQPLVSVIMPCHNRIDTIELAVESVLKQIYRNIELILVDDASTDGTLEWCQKQEDERIVVVPLWQNVGASGARNAGIEKARGKYIMYLDSDNFWDDRYVSAMVGAFSKFPDVDALYSGQFIYQGQQVQPSGIRFGSLNRALLFNRNYIDMNAFCHTKLSLKKIGGFDLDLKRFVDWDLILRFAQNATIRAVPVLLSHYFLGKAANTITADQRYLHHMERVRSKHAQTVVNANGEPIAEILGTVAAKKLPRLRRRISVVIPSYESLDDLKDCIEAILSLRSKLIEIIVVDNASSNEVVEYITAQTQAGLIRSICNSDNYGFTYAVNQGIEVADERSDVILLNNDAIVTAGAFEMMQKAAYELDRCGLIVPQQVLPANTKTLQEHVPYAVPDYACDVNLSAHHLNVQDPCLYSDGKATEISFAPFFCVYIPRSTLNQAGLLDAEYGRHYRSDRIYCDVVRHILGLRIYHIADAVVVHKLQKSTERLRKSDTAQSEFELMFKRNQWDDATREKLGFNSAAWDF